MVRNHLKTLKAPKSWILRRKENKFTTRPNPGSHSFVLGFSINHVLKEEIKICNTTRETKAILSNKECYVNGKVIDDIHYNVGFMDVISIPKLNKNFRVVLDSKGRLTLIEINEKEANIIISKVTNKTIISGNRLQINTLNGINILYGQNEKGEKAKKDLPKTSDSLVIEVPSYKIIKILRFEEGCQIIIISGRYMGTIATLEKIENDKLFFKKDNQIYETLKKFAFVIGKDKPEIKIR